ncbi:MAG: LUD domain-containing protein [Gemmatimonadetes bacterium]|nr:LUD domain-containing protein [Gemmatimonadota bacterium]
MSSRQEILDAVRRNRPDARPLPDLPTGAALPHDAVERFAAMVREVGGEAVITGDVSTAIHNRYPEARRVISMMDGAPFTAGSLDGIDLVIIRGELGVVENGAIWVAESAMGHRALPFVTMHLVLVLRATDLVADMHGAYAALGLERRTPGFGVFISGPSKTADIERALVIGAQGPRSLMVVITPP